LAFVALVSHGPAAIDGSAASHGPACGGTVVARAQRHTHGLWDVDGLAGLQGDVAADADGDGAQSVQVVRGNISDRKSTRLNSSHVSISYAVFCLKKKKNK